MTSISMRKDRNKGYDYMSSITNSYVDYFRAELLNGFNLAERSALQAEEALEKEKRMKREHNEQSMRSYKENNRKFKKEKNDALLLKTKQKEQLSLKAKEKMNYNKRIKDFNLNRFKKEREADTVNKAFLVNTDQNEQEKNYQYHNDANLQVEKEGDIDKPIVYDKMNSEQKDNNKEIQAMPNDDKNNSTTAVSINLRKGIDETLNTLLRQQENKPFTKNNSEYPLDEIASNLKLVSLFRRTGFKSITQSSSPSKKADLSLNPFTKEKQKTREDVRFHKALKQILTERLGEKNIFLPNICSCGQLQSSLDTLISQKNISVYSVFNITCANNCIYYKKRNDYEKSINDILSSVRDLSFEAFYSNAKRNTASPHIIH